MNRRTWTNTEDLHPDTRLDMADCEDCRSSADDSRYELCLYHQGYDDAAEIVAARVTGILQDALERVIGGEE